jgi:hypothetical protein
MINLLLTVFVVAKASIGKHLEPKNQQRRQKGLPVPELLL